METLGSEFDGYFARPADGTRGGVLLAWKSQEITVVSPMITTNAVTALVTSGQAAWWITVVYGPQDDAAKVAFLNELRNIRAVCPGPWLLCGDFNLILNSTDKNNGMINRRMMGRFRRFVNDCALKDVYLHGRMYTWSSERDTPTLVRLDRVLCTSDWEDAHADCFLRCLTTAHSDHCPLFLDCAPQPPAPGRFHFEQYWMRLEGFQETVTNAWNSIHDDDPFCRLTRKLQITARQLTSWSARKTGNIKLQICTAREIIFQLDKVMEARLLTNEETWLRKRLKQTYLGLTSLERTMARQRSRIAWARDGDANTSFFHRQATYRRQKNKIHTLQVGDAHLT
jgi:exonuclease III